MNSRFFRATVLLICFSLFFTLSSCSKKMLALSNPAAGTSEQLIPLNKNAKAQRIDQNQSQYMFYQFQKKPAKTQEPLSLKLVMSFAADRLSGQDNSSNTVTVAFLYDQDFSGGKLISQLSPRHTAKITGLTADTAEKISVSVLLPQSAEVLGSIQGFLVHSTADTVLESASLDEPFFGCTTGDIFSCGFGTNGGIISAAAPFADFDFSEAAEVFSSTYGNALQYVNITFRDQDDTGPLGQQNKAVLSTTESDISVRRAPGQTSVKLYAPRLKNGALAAGITAHSEMVTGVSYIVEKDTSTGKNDDRPLKPINTDPGLIFDWSKELWRKSDYEVFSWEQFPSVLIFDFADYNVQDNFLKRLAFYTEKAGYKGKLWTDKDLEGLHGYNAHDYSAEGLAKFFDSVHKENFQLNPQELELRALLADRGVIVATENGWTAGEGALISISQESPRYLRVSLMAHECYHGIYFTRPELREEVSRVYAAFDPMSLQFLEEYYTSQPSLNYDRSDRMLMENEMMSYLMQQAITEVSYYFSENLANRASVTKQIPELARYVRETKARGFTEAAEKLQDFFYEEYGLAAGRCYLVMY